MPTSAVVSHVYKAWVVVLSASLFFFFEFVQMSMFNTISSNLMEAFDIQGAQFGILSAGYFYANVLFLFPAGLALDRFSTRKLILLGICVSVLSVLGLALATNFYFALLMRFMIGLASTLCFLSASRLASRWFPANRLALVIGVIVTFAMMGGFIAQAPLSLLVETVGWRHTLWVDGAVGLIFVYFIYRNVFDFPPSYQDTHHANLAQLHAMGLGQSIRRALGNLQNWLGGIYTSLLNLSIFLIGSSFGTLYLQQAHHFSKTQAALASSMVFLGTIFGSPILGIWSDRIGRRRRPMIICAVIALAIILMIMTIPSLNLIIAIPLFWLLGFFTSAQIISYPLITESNPTALTSTAVSIASVLIMSGGAVFQPLFGWLLDSHWSHQMSGGYPLYTQADFNYALAVLPITLLIGIVVATLAKETYGKPQFK